MMGFILVGNHVELTPVPIPPCPRCFSVRICSRSSDNENENDNERGTSVPLNPRSLHSSFFYLSIDGHTLYLYPDGTHDSMSLWVCDVNDNILIHEIFDMDGESKSPILSQNFRHMGQISLVSIGFIWRWELNIMWEVYGYNVGFRILQISSTLLSDNKNGMFLECFFWQG